MERFFLIAVVVATAAYSFYLMLNIIKLKVAHRNKNRLVGFVNEKPEFSKEIVERLYKENSEFANSGYKMTRLAVDEINANNELMTDLGYQAEVSEAKME